MVAQNKQLDFYTLIELGKTIEKELVLASNKEKNELKIYVESDIFNKIDEDIYYRQFPDSKDFTPSQDTILINFEYLTIIIKRKESK